jgi:hypothetical protein
LIASLRPAESRARFAVYSQNPMKTPSLPVAVLCAAVLTLPACGGGGGGTTTPTPVTTMPAPPARAELIVSISPDSPVAQPSGDRTYPWTVEWIVVLRETAGLGGNVNKVDVGFVNSFGFETKSALNYGATEIKRRAGTNHLAARGELHIPLAMIYRADGFGGRTIRLKNAIDFTDDRGNRQVLGASANVLLHDGVPF